MYNGFFKPAIDFSASFLCLLLLSPVLIIISLLLLVVNRGNAFFFQQRTGKDGGLFWIIKFRTMNNKRDREGKLLPDKERLTLIGNLIRKTSLDELPQIINIIRGDMSLIGPRPLLPKYLPLYNKKQNRRHEVKPGITGWAQVNGRNAISWEKKFEYDAWYVDHISFLLDLKIIFLTLKKVLIREGISSADNVTMKPFTGNN